MKYSVVMPVYLKDEDHKVIVEKTVKNIKAVSRDYEFIIVDDGSPLPTDWLTQYADNFIKHERNKGISAAWNTGKNAAQADYVAIVNDDIKVPLLWLETLSEAFNDERCGVSAPQQGGRLVSPYRTLQKVLVENYKFYPGYCFMLKKDRFFADFDEQFTTNCGDVDYWHRIKSANLKCMRVGLGVWHKEGGVLHGMDYDNISQVSIQKFINKHRFNPQEVYYS